MHFSRKFSLFATFLETVRQLCHILVLLCIVEEKLDVDVLVVVSTWHYIVVCYRCAAGVPAKFYRSDRILAGDIGNSNKLTKS